MLRTVGRFLMCSLLLTVAAPFTTAQHPEPAPTPPWRLSWEERMALRSALPLQEHDPDLRASGLPMRKAPSLDLDGTAHPGALAPWEIFMVFAAMAFSADEATRDDVRDKVEARIADPEMNRRDLWSRLEAAAAPYLALDEQRDRVMAEAVEAPDAAKAAIYAQLPSEEDYCRLRAVALDAARREFGNETFDRFLYEAVAPGVQMSTTMTPAEVKETAAGCPDANDGTDSEAPR